MKCCEYSTRGCIQNTSFSSELMIGSNKIEFLTLKSLYNPKYNPILQLIGLIHKLQRKKCCEYGTRLLGNRLYSSS
jgi:hypothetical protein